MWARSYGAVELSRAAAVTTSVNRTAVDMAAYPVIAKREMKAIVNVGTLTTTTTATVAVTESDASNGTFTAPTYGTSSVVATAAGITELNFRADKRYIRAEIVVDATGSVPISVVAVALKREG